MMFNLTTNRLKVHESEPASHKVLVGKSICEAQIHGDSTRQSSSAISRRSSMQSSRKAQFMIVTIVLIGLAFFTMFLLTRTIDRSAVVMFEPHSTHFDNLRNAIIQRNAYALSETGFCQHMNDTARAAGEKLECRVQNTYTIPPDVIQINYSIDYSTPNLKFRGFLS